MSTTKMKLSVITPSYNQGDFLERTVQSVLEQQGDFDLEYLVVDGGSTDSSLDILRRYGSHLTWTSEKDRGQGDAINKGFHRATGDVLCWLNSDDTFEPGALACIADTYRRQPFDWCFGDCKTIDESDREIRRFITRYKQAKSRRYSFSSLLRRNFVSQPATFFARAAWEQVGDVDLDQHYATDYDFILRFAKRSNPIYIPRFLANFRWHKTSKSATQTSLTARLALDYARKHAAGQHRLDLAWHRLHYHAQSLLYRLL